MGCSDRWVNGLYELRGHSSSTKSDPGQLAGEASAVELLHICCTERVLTQEGTTVTGCPLSACKRQPTLPSNVTVAGAAIGCDGFCAFIRYFSARRIKTA